MDHSHLSERSARLGLFLATLASAGGAQTLIKDINPTGDSSPEFFRPVGDLVLFHADDGVHGVEPWVTDGTPEGTKMLFDATLGPGDSSLMPGPHGRVIITAGDSQQQWITDGTPEGTTPLPATEVPVTVEQHWNGDVGYFTPSAAAHPLGAELWRTDLTLAGTYMVKDIRPGTLSSNPEGYTFLGDEIFFHAITDATGRELWKSDGTEAGTVLVKELNPGTSVGIDLHTPMVTFQGAVFFPGVGTKGLWKSDGTEAGTVNVAHSGKFVGNLVVLGDRLLHTVRSIGTSAQNLFATDGTTAGTVLLTSPTVMVEEGLFRAGTRVFFWAPHSASARTLWISDGTAAGTQAVKTMESDPVHLAWGDPGSGTTAAFSFNEPGLGREPWFSDGTEAGTHLIADIEPSGGSIGSDPRGYARVRAALIFDAIDGVHGHELHGVPLSALPDFVAEPFGSGCAGSGGLVPELSTSGEPLFGSSFALEVRDALALAPAVLVYGVDGAFAAVGGGCTQFVAEPFFAAFFALDAAGSATLAVPVLASLVGVYAVGQVLVLDPGGAFGGFVSSTNGVEVLFAL